MSNLEVLKEVENPLNEVILNRIIGFYSQNNDNIYSNIMSGNKRNNSRINEEDRVAFNNSMFNSWKNEILNLSEKEAIDLFEEVKIDKDFIPLRNFVSKHSDIENEEEFKKLVVDNDLENTYNAYKWDSNRLAMTPWIYAYSNKINSHKYPPFEVKHNLFINTNCDDTYKMASLFKEACEKKGLPYCFKLNESPFRDDSIIIYSSDELLEEYTNILDDIKKEDPLLVSRINNPPMLSAKLKYYGYGGEPSKDEEGRFRSYNEVRTTIIERSILEITKRWLYRNRNLSLNGVTIMEALAKEYSSRLFTIMKNEYVNALEYEKTTSYKSRMPFNQSLFDSKMGYNLSVLRNGLFQNEVNTIIKNNLTRLLNDDNLFNREQSQTAIEIPVGSYKNYSISYGDITRIIKRNVGALCKFDKNIVNYIINGIRRECERENIELGNFAFTKDYEDKEDKKEKEIIKSNQLDFPEFEELRELATKYKIGFDRESNKLRVINIETNMEEKDIITSQNALFANIWLESVGLKPKEGEARRGLEDAFDVDGALLYRFFKKGCIHSIEKTGNLNSLFLFKNASKLKMENAELMIANLFKDEYHALFLDNYVCSRVDSEVPKTKKTEVIESVESAKEKVEAIANKKKK